ncbi:MAG TPA: peptidoglycan editing factor PgeF [Silvibacterium sp.]|nr:peptidoglycan editing factor PgeF [Silvibacterium sp.]
MPRSPESASAKKNIDELLANVGLSRGRRKILLKGTYPQAKHAPQRPRKLSYPATLPQQAPATSPRQRIDVIRSPLLADIDWLVSGFSTRTGGKSVVYSPGQATGDLNLAFTATDSAENVQANRSRFLKEVTGDDAFPLVTLYQIHSSLIRRVTAEDAGEKARWKADAMMTSDPGLLLAIQTADCIPVLIADRKRRVVAAFHAGWRGTLKRIVENGVGRMRLEFGSKPKDLVAAIGPGIGQCCYAVGEDVRNQFLSQFGYAEALFCDVYDSDPVKEKYPMLFLTARAPGHSNLGPSLHLDLAEANRRQLLDAGLHSTAISVVEDCTSCRADRYFSYRASHGFTGRMLSVIGIRR